MRKILLAAVCITAAGLCSDLRAQVFTYRFDDVSSGSSDSAGGSADHLTFSSFTAAGVSAASNASNLFSFTGWPTGATNNSNVFSGTLDATAYYEFTVAPEAGYTLSLTSVTFAAGRSGTGPRQFAVRSSVDGFAANLSASATNANSSVVGGSIFQFKDVAPTDTYIGYSVTLSGGAFLDTSDAVTFRIYAFNAETAFGSFRVDNVAVYGSATASAIPEPATYVGIAGVCALAGAIAVRRRRGRRAA